MGVPRDTTFLSELSFFTLTSEIAAQFRANLFRQIHEIVFHGKGGYDWETIYNMPRWLRLFTFKQIDEYYKKEAEMYEGVKKGGNTSTLIDASGNINKEAFKEVAPKLKEPSKIAYK